MNITRDMTIGENTQTFSYTLTGIEMERTYNEVVDRKVHDLLYEVLDEKEYENASEIPTELIDEIKEKFSKEMTDLFRTTMENAVEHFEDRLEQYKERLKVFQYEMTRRTTYTISIAAKNEDDADAFMERKFGSDEYAFDDELSSSGAESEYDYGYAEEVEGNPEYADYNVEEE